MGRVIVFGSINMDCVTTVARHPVPGETLTGGDLYYSPGGKGSNQAVAAARLGAPTLMFGSVGKDSFGKELAAFLAVQGVDTAHISAVDDPTGMAFIVVDKAGENTIIIIAGANAATSYEQIASFAFAQGDVLVCQNEVSGHEMMAVFRAARSQGARIVYNPAPAVDVPPELFAWADYLVVNETEADFYKDRLQGKGRVLIETLGAGGVRVTTDNAAWHLDGHAVDVVDTTGAGDCFVGALASGIAGGRPLEDSVRFANKAASLSIQRRGAAQSMPVLAEMPR